MRNRKISHRQAEEIKAKQHKRRAVDAQQIGTGARTERGTGEHQGQQPSGHSACHTDGHLAGTEATTPEPGPNAASSSNTDTAWTGSRSIHARLTTRAIRRQVPLTRAVKRSLAAGIRHDGAR